MKNLNLRNKLIIIILTVSFITLLFSALFFVVSDIQRFKNELVESSKMIAQVVGNNIIAEISFDDKESAEETLKKLSSIPTIKNAVIFKSGTMFASYTAQGSVPEKGAFPKNYGYRFTDKSLQLYEKIFFNGQYYGDIYINASKELLNKKIQNDILCFSYFYSCMETPEIYFRANSSSCRFL